MTHINEYYDVRLFEGTINEETGLTNYKMDPYYELLRMARKSKNRTTNIPIYVYGYHKKNENIDDYDLDLNDEETFLKAAFIQQISDGKLLLKDDIYGLSSDKNINWKKILE